MTPVYLDHNATTAILPAVEEAMRPFATGIFGNPASAHAAGRAARRALDDARERLAALLGAHPDEVTFTSGATEANNLAVFGLLGRAGGVSPLFNRGAPSTEDVATGGVSPLFNRGAPSTEDVATGGLRPPLAVASHLEHPCVIEPLKQLAAHGVPVEWLPVNARGMLERGALPAQVGSLVCLMLANHETGALQPVAEVARGLPPGTRLHCDAAQAVGKVPVNFHALGASTLSASAHKFCGPKGIGLLLLKRGVELTPLTFGGHQQGGRRPGTEPVALAVGMAVALEHAVRHLDENRTKLEAIRARFWEGLERTCAPVVLNGPEIGAPDIVPTTLNVSFPGCRADLLLMALDLDGVACSTGSACSSGSLLPSPVLRAMNVPDEVLRSAIRFSFAPNQPLEEIDEALRRVAGCVNRLRRGG